LYTSPPQFAPIEADERARCVCVRVGVEVERIFHQGSADVFIGLDPGGSEGEVERGTRHLLEALVLPQQAAQPSVFELLQAQHLGDHLAFSRT
jgi:hypothetical protein